LEGDGWADLIIGQPDFSEISVYKTVANKLDMMGGVLIDRNITAGAPFQKFYAYDCRHHRVLGWNWDELMASSANPCNIGAQRVLGQPDMNSSAGNGDSGFQNYPVEAPASAGRLRGLLEGTLSVSEGGSAGSMAVDGAGNLYVFDTWNNRVLKYNAPFESGSDGVADEVWGQNDFTGKQPNKGMADPDATSLRYWWSGDNCATAGVEVDSQGNLWVADMKNNRVLRFPAGSKTADLVLGQPDFVSTYEDTSFGIHPVNYNVLKRVDLNGDGWVSEEEKREQTNKFAAPTVVKVNGQGWVYVVDEDNRRVLRFKPPFSNGMAGELFGFGLIWPTGMEFDPTEGGRVWILDGDRQVIELWEEGTQAKVVGGVVGTPGDGNLIGGGGGRRARGSFGVDGAGDVMIVPGYGGRAHRGLLFKKGGGADQNRMTVDQEFFSHLDFVTSDELGWWESGVVVSDNQLIVADRNRLMFWDNPSTLVNGQAASGYGGGESGQITSFQQFDGAGIGIMVADQSHHLWCSVFNTGNKPHRIFITTYAAKRS
jgi:sugar lactone lactonase YvrE